MQGEHQATLGGGVGEEEEGTILGIYPMPNFKVTRGILKQNVYLLCSFSHLTQAHRG